MKRLKQMAVWTVVSVLAFTLFACQEQTPQAQPVAKGGLIGEIAPDLTLVDMEGRTVSLAQYRGKVVILNFWATWCPPCREEMPSMEELHRRFKDRGLVMLAVNVEDNGKDAVAEFLKKTPYSFPILLDEDKTAQTTYGVFRFPETFVIDRNGRVVEKIIGARNWLSGPTFKLINFLVNG